jgi:thioredoxin-related protein
MINKNSLTLISFLLLISHGCLIAQDKSGIRFQTGLSWQQILDKAKAEHKYIFADVYTTWCTPCKRMDQEIYTDSSIGALMNQNFISVKIQMDSTSDGASAIQKTYKITGYPSFLFFSPDGEWVYKDLGYKDKASFTKLVLFAADPERKDFRAKLTAYQNGQKDYTQMAELAQTARDLGEDKNLAFKIALDYKEHYLDKLSDKALLTKNNLEFISQNGAALLINSGDRFFYTCYYHPEIIDSILGFTGYADINVKSVISQEEVTKKLFSDTILINKHPNWKRLKNTIHQKYKKLNIDEFILNEKISFYRRIEDWDIYTELKSEQISKNPPKAEGMNVFYQLNIPAWDVFLHSYNKIALQRALEWSELSIKLESNLQYLDTRSNLLYKSGKLKEAIISQEQAFEADRAAARLKGRKYIFSYIGENLKKMKNDEPTWLSK